MARRSKLKARRLRDLDETVKGLRPEIIEGIQQQGVAEAARLSALFNASKYVDAQGNPQQVKPYSIRWGKRKAALNFSMERGNANGVLRGVLALPSVVRMTSVGYRFDPSRASHRIRRSVIGTYLAAFAYERTAGGAGKGKAPGLFKHLEGGWQDRHFEAITNVLRAKLGSQFGPMQRALGKAEFNLQVAVSLKDMGLGKLVGAL